MTFFGSLERERERERSSDGCARCVKRTEVFLLAVVAITIRDCLLIIGIVRQVPRVVEINNRKMYKFMTKCGVSVETENTRVRVVLEMTS